MTYFPCLSAILPVCIVLETDLSLTLLDMAVTELHLLLSLPLHLLSAVAQIKFFFFISNGS